MGHLVNPIGIRLNYSLTWSDHWNATDRVHYFNYYSNVILVKTYLNYFFSREYIENYGIFFSYFSIFLNSNKFLIEINLYDGRVEDWIETCTNLFSQDLRRLVSYSLKSFRLNFKNAEFARSTDYSFFRFLILLILKLLFKSSDKFFKCTYLKNLSDPPYTLFSSIINFLVLQNQKEDLVIRKSTHKLKFFLRLFSILFYQTPLYTHFTNTLKINIFNILKVYPKVVVFGAENKNVTSSFISRFLARKLAQKYK